MDQFLDKMGNFKYLGPNLPKTGFWGRNSKNLSLDLESVSLRYNVLGAQATLNFRNQIWPKMDFGLGFQNFKNLILDSESTSPLYDVCQFSVKMDNVWFFDLNLEKLPIT